MRAAACASPESGGKILRSILYQSGCDVAKVKLLGTHSLKATALSWCAKFGLERVTRATLGYHASGRQGTELIYGRDNIASPLRDLEHVIQEVARKRPPEQYEELSDSSSQGSENEDQPDHSEDEQAADAMVGQFGPVPLEERGLFRRKISRVIHVCVTARRGLSLIASARCPAHTLRFQAPLSSCIRCAGSAFRMVSKDKRRGSRSR